MDWIRCLLSPSAFSISHRELAFAASLAGPHHDKGRRRRHKRGRRCRRRRKGFGILALVVAFLAGRCCGKKSGGCGSCGCKCSCAGGNGCCCCKGGGGESSANES